MAEQKIKTSANFSPRQVSALSAEARRLGISENELLRRIVDSWLDAKETFPALTSRAAAQKPA